MAGLGACQPASSARAGQARIVQDATTRGGERAEWDNLLLAFFFLIPDPSAALDPRHLCCWYRSEGRRSCHKVQGTELALNNRRDNIEKGKI